MSGLSVEQQSIVDRVVCGRENVVFTGPAGVGKSKSNNIFKKKYI